MSNIFEIESEEITRLKPQPFVDFMNRLIRSEGSRIGLSPKNIYTSLQIYRQDEGIDAKIVDNDKKSRWLCNNNSIWQFRTGNITSSKLKDEIQKHKKVQDYVKKQYTYFFCNNQEHIPEKTQEFEKTMRICFIELGTANPTVKFFTAQDIAEWASEIPALSYLPYFNKPLLADFMRWEEWQAIPRFQQPFKADKHRKNILSEMKRQLLSDSILHLRIEGLAGVGKTRLAMECFRPQNIDDPNEEGIQDIIMYALSPDNLPSGLFSWVKTHTQTNLILVVDECDRIDADRLQQLTELCNGRVKLITIGLAQEAKAIKEFPPGTFLLEKLDDKSMRELLKEIYPSLPEETIAFVIRFASGFVKLAVVLAKTISSRPELASSTDLSSIYEVKEILDKFLVPDVTERKVMQGIALLTTLGWDGDLESEGKTVMEFLEVQWQIAKNIVNRYFNEGLIVKKGRYRYVTPHLLATYLATESWEIYGDNIIYKLLPELPNWRARKSLLERLKDLGDHPKSKEVVEYLLGQDIFPDLAAIDNEERAAIFAILVENNPGAGLIALKRILMHLSGDKLSEFKAGRRHIIGALEKLAWLPETFIDSARILLILAEAENEEYGNNATNTWIGLFKTYLGGTAVPAIERHSLIKEILKTSSKEKKILAIKGINAALLVGHEFRFGGAEIQGGRIVPKEWRPKTIEEDHQVRLSALSLLDTALSDDDSAIREQAEQVLLQSSRGLITTGLIDEVIERLKRLPLEDTKRKREIRETIEAILEWEDEYLSYRQREELKQFLERLRGQSFGERLRRWIGQLTIQDYRLEKGIIETKIRELAEESLRNPDILEPEFDWLTSKDAGNISLFGKYLGQLDEGFVLFEKIESITSQGKGIILLSSYLYGHVLAGRKQRRDSILDSWVKEGNSKAQMVLDAIWHSSPDDNDIERLVKLIKEKHLSPEKLSLLMWGGMIKELAKDVFHKLAESLLIEPENIGGINSTIQLLAQRLHFYPNEVDDLELIAWQVLENYKPVRVNTLLEHDWKYLARQYVKKNPARLVKLIMSIFEEADRVFIQSDPLIELLSEATKLSPEDAWLLVSKQLMRKDRVSFRLYLALKGWYSLVVGDKILLRWAEHNRPEGPYIVAQITSVHGVPLNTLAREIIIRFGSDKDIASALYANFGEGTFSGSIVTHLKSQLSVAQQWLKDSHPAVREWAQRLVNGLKKEIIREKQREEEEFV